MHTSNTLLLLQAAGFLVLILVCIGVNGADGPDVAWITTLMTHQVGATCALVFGNGICMQGWTRIRLHVDSGSRLAR